MFICELRLILFETMRHYYLIVIFFAFCGCNTPQEDQSKYYTKDTLISDVDGFPKDSLALYFPLEIYKNGNYFPTEIDKFWNEHYSLYLNCFEEPILYNYYLNRDIYRFLWLRSFHDFVLITIENKENKIYLTTKILDKQPTLGSSYFSHSKTFIPPTIVEQDTVGLKGKELIEARKYNSVAKQHNKRVKKLAGDIAEQRDIKEYSPTVRTKIKLNKTTILTKKEWNHFLKLLEENKFWEMPPEVKGPPGCDGAQWVLEGHTEDNYWFVDRWSPDDSIRYCCEYLIKLSEARNEEIY